MQEKKIRIGYFADGLWSYNAFEKIIADDTIEVAFICPRSDTKDLTLKEFSNKYKIDYHITQNINDASFVKLVKNYNCDLFVSMSFNQIFKSEIIDLTPMKIINCHAGKLPFYRGRNILNWVLINDEKEFGVTVHYVDSGIDTGDIILQKSFPITDNDNYQTLLERAYIYCANVLYDAIKLLQKGVVVPLKQKEIHPVGTYCGIRQQGDEIIDWSLTSREIFNFVRAICKPGPSAQSFVGGKAIYINKVSIINDAPEYKCIPGQIVGKNDNKYIIKTGDSTVQIEEFAFDDKLKIGDRLLDK